MMKFTFLALLSLLCIAAGPTTKEVRALWVARGEYESAKDVEQIIHTAAEMNFNVILFQVRGNGTVYYKSKIEPWAFELTSKSPKTTGKDPGWDPLATAVAAARKNDVELHAWVNVFPAWRSQDYPPKASRQLWWSHPDWFMCDAAGKRMIPRDHDENPKIEDWYSFLSPGVPQVQDYLAGVFEELVKNYEVDGIHYDYIRYPREIREVDKAFAKRAEKLGNWSYDPVSLKRFTQETKVKTPDDDPKAWIDWRADQVTETVRKSAECVRSVRPKIIITAAVGADPVDARNGKAQSYIEWLEKGYIDAAILMGYTADNEKFKADRQNIVTQRPTRGYVVAGIGMGNGVEKIAQQIEIARSMKLDGFCGFSAGRLKPKKGDAEKPLSETLRQAVMPEKTLPVWK